MILLLALLILATPALAQDRFYQFSADQDHLSGAPDFGFMNHPLGSADRLFVRDGHFYRVGTDLRPNSADDERVRLFGVNMAFGANFPTPEDAPRIAKRLRRLGVNLVRLHHMDTSPDRNPEDARSILTTGPYPTLNPISVARLRAFLDALKAEGIYANLNLHVGYVFRPEIDQVPALPNGVRMPQLGKPLHIFFPRMIDLEVEFARKVIEALKLKDDPVLGMVEIDNESSLLEAWGRGNLDRYALGDYKTELQKQWNVFLRSNYSTTQALRSAWGELAEGQSLDKDQIALIGSKESGPQKRLDDYLLFLTGRDRAYLRRMLDAVRASTDRLVPVAGTQMGYGGLLNLDSHQDMDYQDNHFYVDHYNFPHQAWDGRDWRIRDISSVGSGLTNFLNMAIARESGKPYTVSEFNQPWPNRQAAEIDPTLAAFGAFQDWDSIMHFAYEHGRSWDAEGPSAFNINGDWTKVPNIGQSAWLFRSGALQAGKSPATIQVTPDLKLQGGREKRVGNVSSGLAAATGYNPAIAFVHPVGIRTGEGRVTFSELTSPYHSDTGELTYDRDRKLMIISAPKAAGIFGFLGTNAKVGAGTLTVELTSTSRGFASVLLTPLDQQPIEESGRLLLTNPGYTLGTQPGSTPPRPQKLINYGDSSDWWTLEPDPASGKPSGNMNGHPSPVWMERVECTITLRSSATHVTVYPLDRAGARMTPLADKDVRRSEGAFEVHIQGDGQELSPWYELIAEKPSR